MPCLSVIRWSWADADGDNERDKCLSLYVRVLQTVNTLPQSKVYWLLAHPNFAEFASKLTRDYMPPSMSEKVRREELTEREYKPCGVLLGNWKVWSNSAWPRGYIDIGHGEYTSRDSASFHRLQVLNVPW